MRETSYRELGDIADIAVIEISTQPQHCGNTLQDIAALRIDGPGKVHHDGKLAVAEREHGAPL
jgi:hypothetical protein